MRTWTVAVVIRGIQVQGVYPDFICAVQSLPADTDLEPCPDPIKGYNGRGKDRELRIRATLLHGWKYS